VGCRACPRSCVHFPNIVTLALTEFCRKKFPSVESLGWLFDYFASSAAGGPLIARLLRRRDARPPPFRDRCTWLTCAPSMLSLRRSLSVAGRTAQLQQITLTGSRLVMDYLGYVQPWRWG